MTTRLLVSIVSVEEVAAALEGGADIVDVKDPREGSLGAPRPGLLRAVREATPGHVPVSCALGDMPHLPGTAALAAAGAVHAGADHVKVGLWGSRDAPAARALMAAVVDAVRAIDPRVRVIATAYADGRGDGLLAPAALPEVAAAAGAHGCMLDTLHKGAGTLRSVLAEHDLASFVEEGQRRGLLVALAGSLGMHDLPGLLGLCRPDIVGVRGAACAGGARDGAVDAARVAALKAMLVRRGGASAPAPTSLRL